MAATATGLIQHRSFALRRLHSLTGIVPVGVFLINHLLANSTAFLGREAFDHHIRIIHDLPWLLAIEITFIFIPLAFHGIYGLIIALQGRPNQLQYPYMDNWRYTLQRVTAYITLVFVVIHLLHFRFAHWFGIAESYAAAYPEFLVFTVGGFQGSLLGIPTWLWVIIYIIGVLAAVFHFCNGIVTFCITWGIVVGDESRKRLGVIAGTLGIVLVVWGMLSLYAIATMTPADFAEPAAHEHATLCIQSLFGLT